MRYFAYGSNMESASMRHYCPGAQPLGPARLDGYRLGYNHFSAPRGCGVADIEPAADSSVWGVLYEVPDAELERMDRMESAGGQPNAYTPLEVTVLPQGDVAQSCTARTYAVRDKQPGQTPSAEYLAALASGAREHGLPEEYVVQFTAQTAGK